MTERASVAQRSRSGRGGLLALATVGMAIWLIGPVAVDPRLASRIPDFAYLSQTDLVVAWRSTILVDQLQLFGVEALPSSDRPFNRNGPRFNLEAWPNGELVDVATPESMVKLGTAPRWAESALRDFIDFELVEPESCGFVYCERLGWPIRWLHRSKRESRVDPVWGRRSWPVDVGAAGARSSTVIKAPAFIANAAIGVVVCALMAHLISSACGRVRTAMRRRHGGRSCLECGYPRVGLARRLRCPECGCVWLGGIEHNAPTRV